VKPKEVSKKYEDKIQQDEQPEGPMNVPVQQGQVEINVVEALEVYSPSSVIFQNMVDFYPCLEEVLSRETTKLARKALKKSKRSNKQKSFPSRTWRRLETISGT